MTQRFDLVILTSIFLLKSINGVEWSLPLPVETDTFFSRGQYNTNISTLYNPSTHTLIAAWAGQNLFPCYAIFDGIEWINKGIISSSSCVLSNVFLCREPNLNQIIAIWIDTSLNYFPQYAIYEGGNWTPKGILTTQGSSGFNVFACYDGNLKQLIATWVDSTYSLRYALYDGTKWLDQNTVDTININFDIMCCYSENLGFTVATWKYDNLPYFSVFDGKTWTSGAPITLSTTTSFNISCLADPNSNLVFAFFADSFNYPCFATYDGRTWSEVTRITINSKAARDLSCATKLNSNEIFSAWTDLSNNMPYSGITNGSSTDSLIQISEESTLASRQYGTSLTFNPSGRLFATWIDISGYPFYATYGADLNPPNILSWSKAKHEFGLLHEYVNTINWKLSDSENIVGYEIYRDNRIIATVDAATKKYEDHNQPRNTPTRYSIYAINTFGGRSLSQIVVIH